MLSGIVVTFSASFEGLYRTVMLSGIVVTFSASC